MKYPLIFFTYFLLRQVFWKKDLKIIVYSLIKQSSLSDISNLCHKLQIEDMSTGVGGPSVHVLILLVNE